MRKKVISLLSLLLIMAVMLCGCHNNSSESETGDELTKAQWIGLLGDKFGYNTYENTEAFYADVGSDNEYYSEIQACAEWEILSEKEKFQPADEATWLYAIETSVRAIGIDKLNSAEIGMKVTEENLVECFTNYIANIESDSLNMALSETDAELILAYAYNYAVNLVLPQKMNYTYNEGVKEVSADAIDLKGDGVTALVRDGSSYKEGDIIYVLPSEENEAYAMRVAAVNGTQITYEQAGMEDIYAELQISGTFQATIIHVEPADGVTISLAKNDSVQPVQAVNMQNALTEIKTLKNTKEQRKEANLISTGVKANSNSIKFNMQKDNISLEAAVSDISVTSDVDFGILSGLKKADMTLSFRDNITAKYEMEHVSRQIPLGTVEVMLGGTPLTAKLSLVANLGFDGKVTLTYSSKFIANVNYKKGNGLGKSVSNENPQCDFHADATVTVEPCIKAELCCLGRGLANVKVISGVVAIANVDADLLENQPTCSDIYLYVPLRWSINEDGCVMTSISSKLRASGVVWDSENSPINMHFHWEDGVLVDACTRKEKIETAPVDEEGVPYDEYKIFAFEEIVFGFIKVASQNLYLSNGESMTIGILALPDGYSMSDLVYQVENPSVCSAEGGLVRAIGSGSTTLHVATSDGKYNVYLTVVVEAEYNDTSGFQPL